MIETEMLSLIEADLNKTIENKPNNNNTTEKKAVLKWIRIKYD